MKVMFSGVEVITCMEASPHTPQDQVRAIMTRTGELVAARGGTMTAEGLSAAFAELRESLESATPSTGRDDDLLRLWQVRAHSIAQGARLVVVAAQLEESAACLAVAKAEMDAARQERATARLAITAGNGMLEDARKEVEVLKTAGAVLSAHVDKTAGEVATQVLDIRSDGTVVANCTTCGAAYSKDSDDSTCAPCTPLKPNLLGPVLTTSNAEAFDEGAEAMRAACWEAVRLKLQEYGWTSNTELGRAMKETIEGATP